MKQEWEIEYLIKDFEHIVEQLNYEDKILIYSNRMVIILSARYVKEKIILDITHKSLIHGLDHVGRDEIDKFKWDEGLKLFVYNGKPLRLDMEYIEELLENYRFCFCHGYLKDFRDPQNLEILKEHYGGSRFDTDPIIIRGRKKIK